MNMHTITVPFIILLLCIGGLFAAIDGGEARDMGRTDESRTGTRAPTPGDVLSIIAHNVHYTPILVDFGNDAEIEVIVGDNRAMRCMSAEGEEIWTYQTGGAIHNSPTIADLDNDGTLEVSVVSESDNGLWVIDSEGEEKWFYSYGTSWGDAHHSAAHGDLDQDGYVESLVIPQGNNVHVIGYDGEAWGSGDILSTSLGWHSSPAVGNLDDNPNDLEYIVLTNDGRVCALNRFGGRLQSFGTDGFAQVADGFETTSPALGDIDGDGDNEIVVCGDLHNDKSVYCLDHHGNVLWQYETNGRIESSPALADLDGDNDWEIVVGSYDGNVYCLDHEGQLLWKVPFGESVKASPAVGDIDGDGELEVVNVALSSRCIAIDTDGSILWEVQGDGTLPSTSISADPSPVVGDINSDGYLEVLFTDGEGKLRVIATNGTCPPSALTWPMFRYSREHTGYYNGTLEYGVTLVPDEDNPAANPEESPIVHWVDPGESTTFYLDLINVGHQSIINAIFKDKFDVELNESSLTDGWNATLSAPDIPINPGEINEDDPTDESFDNVLEITDIQLTERESTELQVTVTAPTTGLEYGDFTETEIVAVSQGDPNATARFTLLTFINITIDFEMSFDLVADPILDEKIKEISPGGTAILNLRLFNFGNLNDTIHIELDNPSGGWNWSFEANGNTMIDVELTPVTGPDSSALLSIIVTAPMTGQAGEKMRLSARGISQMSTAVGLPPMERRDEVVLELERASMLQIEVEDSEKMVERGQSVDFDVEIENRGNSHEDVEVWIRGVLEVNGWTAQVPELIDLRAGQKKSITLRLTAPFGARHNDELTLRVYARVLSDPRIVDYDVITAVVKRAYGVDVELISGAGSAPPGGSIEYTVEITNFGNGEETIEPHLEEIGLGWSVTIDNVPIEQSKIVIGIRRSETITVNITVGQYYAPGAYEIVLNLTGEGGVDEDGDGAIDEDPFDEADNDGDGRIDEDRPTTVSLIATVDQIFDSAVTTQKTHAMIDPGRSAGYRLGVTNTGNGVDEITLSVGDAPSNWNIYFSEVIPLHTTTSNVTIAPVSFSQTLDLVQFFEDEALASDGIIFQSQDQMLHDSITLRLAAGQTAYVMVNARVPGDIEEGDYQFVVSSLASISETDLTDNTLTFSTWVRNSDLRFVDIDGDGVLNDIVVSKGEPGDIFTIIVKLANVGNIEATGVTVTFYVDKERMYSKTFDKIPNDPTEKPYTASFTWKADPGEHELKVAIDAADRITELDEENNEMTRTITVEGESVPGFVGIELIIAVIAFLGIVIAIDRRQH